MFLWWSSRGLWNDGDILHHICSGYCWQINRSCCVGAMEWNSGSSSVSCSSVDSRCGLLLSPRRQRKVLWTPSSAEQSDMILKRPVARALAPDWSHRVWRGAGHWSSFVLVSYSQHIPAAKILEIVVPPRSAGRGDPLQLASLAHRRRPHRGRPGAPQFCYFTPGSRRVHDEECCYSCQPRLVRLTIETDSNSWISVREKYWLLISLNEQTTHSGEGFCVRIVLTYGWVLKKKNLKKQCECATWTNGSVVDRGLVST